MAQGYLSRLTFNAAWMRRLFNVWPPFRSMGIRVADIAPDFRRVRVQLRTKLLNRNWVGTHFGGSMFAMADPFYMIMMMRNLGRDYVVWDKAASVRFLKPGRGTLEAEFSLTEEQVSLARQVADAGGRHEPTLAVELKDREGDVVARVEKTLHIRRAGAPRPAPRAH